MTDSDSLQKNAILKHLHDLGGGLSEISVTILRQGDGDHVAVGEWKEPRRAIVVVQATCVEGAVILDEVWLEDQALEAAGHAILRALGTH